MPSLNETKTTEVVEESPAPKATPKNLELVEGDKVTLRHYESLVGELRCPGCAKPLKAPIKLCSNGHSVCLACRRRTNRCAVCKDEFTDTRSVALEALASKIQFPCENQRYGCKLRFHVELLTWHEEKCIYQIGDCFMGKVYGDCKWQGCETDWFRHCEDDHPDKMSYDGELTTSFTYRPEKEMPVISYHIFSVHDQKFNLYHVYDKTTGEVQWTLLCASKNNATASNFYYEIELFSPEDHYLRLVHRQACHSENDDDILAPGYCVGIRLKDVERYVDEDQLLHYKVRVCKWDSPKPQRKPKRTTNIPANILPPTPETPPPIPPIETLPNTETESGITPLLFEREETYSGSDEKVDFTEKNHDGVNTNLKQRRNSVKQLKNDFLNSTTVKNIKDNLNSLKNTIKSSAPDNGGLKTLRLSFKGKKTAKNVKDSTTETEHNSNGFQNGDRKAVSRSISNTESISYEQMSNDLDNSVLNSSTPTEVRSFTALEYIRLNMNS